MTGNDLPDDSAQPRANPFADDLKDVPTADDRYAVASSTEYNELLPGEYEAAPGRGGKLLTWAIVGLAVAIGGMVPLFLAWIPLNMLGLAFTLSAWLLARGDLKAIAVGAIEEGEKSATRMAYFIGMVGTFVALLPLLVVAVLLVFNLGFAELGNALGF